MLYMYGGYSKEKSIGNNNSSGGGGGGSGSGGSSWGRTYTDMWSIDLKSILNNNSNDNNDNDNSSGSINTQITWQKMSTKGNSPTIRCGMSCVIYKNKCRNKQ